MTNLSNHFIEESQNIRVFFFYIATFLYSKLYFLLENNVSINISVKMYRRNEGFI